MLRSLLSWLGSVAVLLAYFLPFAQAQTTDGGSPEGGGGQSSGAFPYLVAFAFTALILLVVCMPSRKG